MIDDNRDGNDEFDHSWKPHMERCWSHPTVPDKVPSQSNLRETHNQRVSQLLMRVSLPLLLGAVFRKTVRGLLVTVLFVSFIVGVLLLGPPKESTKNPPSNLEENVL